MGGYSEKLCTLVAIAETHDFQGKLAALLDLFASRCRIVARSDTTLSQERAVATLDAVNSCHEEFALDHKVISMHNNVELAVPSSPVVTHVLSSSTECAEHDELASVTFTPKCKSYSIAKFRNSETRACTIVVLRLTCA